MEVDPLPVPRTSGRGIFASRRTAGLALALYTAILYSTLNVSYDFYVGVFERIGRSRMGLLVNSVYALLGMGMLVFLVARVQRSMRAYSSFFLIILTAAVFLRLEPVPANRIHFIQYAPLAILAFEVHRFLWKGFQLHAAALGTVFAIGCGDEFLQSLLSKRHFDLHDVWLNTVAGLLALAFVGGVLGSGNYPWGNRRWPIADSSG